VKRQIAGAEHHIRELARATASDIRTLCRPLEVVETVQKGASRDPFALSRELSVAGSGQSASDFEIRIHRPFCFERFVGHRRRVTRLQVFTRDNNVDRALRILEKMQRERAFREIRRKRFYEKPSEKATREKADAVRRSRKRARKQAMRDGPIAAPIRKPSHSDRRGANSRSHTIGGQQAKRMTETQNRRCTFGLRRLRIRGRTIGGIFCSSAIARAAGYGN
jgi:small subunit ribosomal protein S21